MQTTGGGATTTRPRVLAKKAPKAPIAVAPMPEAAAICFCGRPAELDLNRNEFFCVGCGLSDACACGRRLRLARGTSPGIA